ncbi:MAG TPA: preprotein translocase subunit SecE [Vicinamibacterales bacterium]|nr:preprotein translocase subunit SecE [Vicinamibacterales bacterium]
MAIETTDQTSDTTRGALAWWGRAGEFFTEVRNEMKRVTWPSQREVYATTLVVILTSIFFGVYLFAVDLMFSAGVQWILRRFGVSGV